MTRIVRWSVTLNASEYARGLAIIEHRLTDNQRRIFIAHYASPNRTNYASRLAKLAGIETGHGTVNLEYWRMAERFCDAVNQQPDVRRIGKRRWWSIWSQGYKTKYGYMWEMLPQVAEAIEILGWSIDGGFQLPEENPLSNGLPTVERWEGAVLRITVNRYERDSDARKRCIDYYAPRCVVCGFDFEERYGELAAGFIHVHHLKPLSEIGERYQIDPIRDLRPVCPNCHAVIHIGGLTRTIDEVRDLIAVAKPPNKAIQPTGMGERVACPDA